MAMIMGKGCLEAIYGLMGLKGLMQEVHHIMHFGIEKLRFKISRKTEQVKNEILRYLNIYICRSTYSKDLPHWKYKCFSGKFSTVIRIFRSIQGLFHSYWFYYGSFALYEKK